MSRADVKKQNPTLGDDEKWGFGFKLMATSAIEKGARHRVHGASGKGEEEMIDKTVNPGRLRRRRRRVNLEPLS